MNPNNCAQNYSLTLTIFEMEDHCGPKSADPRWCRLPRLLVYSREAGRTQRREEKQQKSRHDAPDNEIAGTRPLGLFQRKGGGNQHHGGKSRGAAKRMPIKAVAQSENPLCRGYQ